MYQLWYHKLPEVFMNTVKEIKENSRCVASITVKVKGRNNLRGNKIHKLRVSKQKIQSNSC